MQWIDLPIVHAITGVHDAGSDGEWCKEEHITFSLPLAGACRLLSAERIAA